VKSPIRCELFLGNIAVIKYPEKTTQFLTMHSELDKTIFHRSIDSTNLEARRRRSDFAHQNVLFISDEQTVGLGQQRRHWESAANLGLWMSLFLARPSTLSHSVRLLSLYTGTVLHKTVAHFVDAKIRLKWPNDIMIDSLKCGGVLTEIQWQGNTALSAILGIGINLKHTSADFSPSIRDSATSLRLAGWQEPDRTVFLNSFIEVFFKHIEVLDKPDALVGEWNDLAFKINDHVQWQTKDSIIEGQFVGINQNGDALIRRGETIQNFQNGEIRQLNSV